MKILIICASNICRSPFVEYLLKREIDSNPMLRERIEWVKSSAVANKMFKIHPKARDALLKEGFTSQEIGKHKPTYIWFNYRRFREADIIIGMTKMQKYMLPFWFYRKYKTLSEVACGRYIEIKDPFFEKTQEGYDRVTDQLKEYVNAYINKLIGQFNQVNNL